MKYFIDTANVEEIKKAEELGIINGVTTNPSLIAKEGRVFEDVIKEITEIIDGPISAEVVSEDAEGMVREADELVKIHENVVIKVPMTAEILFYKQQNSNINIPYCFSQKKFKKRLFLFPKTHF